MWFFGQLGFMGMMGVMGVNGMIFSQLGFGQLVSWSVGQLVS